MAVKKTVEKAVGKTVEKPAAKETAAKAVKSVEKKTAVKTEKVPVKRTPAKETVILQFAGKEVATAEVMKQVKAYWTKELKNKVGDIKDVTLYLKPEESKVYFVINGDVTGSVEL